MQYGWEEIIGMCSKVAEGAWKRVLVQSYVRTMEGGGVFINDKVVVYFQDKLYQ